MLGRLAVAPAAAVAAVARRAAVGAAAAHCRGCGGWKQNRCVVWLDARHADTDWCSCVHAACMFEVVVMSSRVQKHQMLY